MRALPVLKDTIDLLVTAAYITGAGECSCTGSRPRSIAEIEDLGQSLWDENHSSVGFAAGIHLPAPHYEWHPVAELIAPRWTDEQVLQIALTRLYVEEVSCHHEGWDESAAHRVLEDLARWVAQRMIGYPVEASPVDSGVFEYSGINRLPEEWTRDVGWRTNLSAAEATTTFDYPGVRS